MQEKSTISFWLKNAAKSMKDTGIPSARLDAELILANTLRKNRTYLHAHLDEEIDPRRVDIANARLDLRLDRVPMAYILGYKEFYGRKFAVSPVVLVPRPESEDMISLFLDATAGEIERKVLIDIGTGSGVLLVCIYYNIKIKGFGGWGSEFFSGPFCPESTSFLFPREKTRQKRRRNGQLEPVDYIFANLPYVDKNWEVSPELQYEPKIALFTEDGGLKLILELIQQAPRCLTPNGQLFIEADPTQHERIMQAAAKQNFKLAAIQRYIIVLRFIGSQR